MSSNKASASPLNNLLFDFVSVLHAKAEGLEACEKYLRDAEQQNSQPCIEMLSRIIEQDRQMVIELKDHLAGMFQNSAYFERGHAQSASAPH